MSVAKPSSSGSPNAMKSEEMNDSVQPFVRDIGQDPMIHASSTVENTVHWIQLLHAFDQPDLLGWPLMSPIKVPLQKCKKCSLEFCSLINYRRHIRVHRLSSTLNKESNRNKELLAAFWDKLTVEKADEITSFNEVMLKEIPGSSVINALASSLSNPAVWALPQAYVRGGSALLDMIQAKPPGLPMASQDLFSILDEASEKTFLCGGTPESVQNYLFDGEATKTCLQLKNLVASTSFLFEQQLVKAWTTEKDAEALRCQKLLVEEEEAVKKRLADLSERKKQKKLRRKEHKLKELSQQCEGELNVAVDAAERPVLAQVSVPLSPSHSGFKLIHGLETLDSGMESLQNQAQIDTSGGGFTQRDTGTTVSQIVAESNSTYGPENLDSGLGSLQSPEKDLTGEIDFISEGICQGDNETIESQLMCESNSTYGPENVDASLNSLQKVVEAQIDLISGSTSQGDTETIEFQMACESNSICEPEKFDAGLESSQDLEKDGEAQVHLSSADIFQGEIETIYGAENLDLNQTDLSSEAINRGGTETIESQMAPESNSIYGLENCDDGPESLQNEEKDSTAHIGFSCEGITKGGSGTIASYMVCESNQETGKFNSVAPLKKKRVSKKKDEKETSGDGKCDHLFEETNFEFLIGSISIKVNLPAFIVGDVVVSENADCPIILCDGCASVSAPYNLCGNHDHALSSNGLQGITPSSTADAKEFLDQRWNAAVAADHVVLAL